MATDNGAMIVDIPTKKEDDKSEGILCLQRRQTPGSEGSKHDSKHRVIVTHMSY